MTEPTCRQREPRRGSPSFGCRAIIRVQEWRGSGPAALHALIVELQQTPDRSLHSAVYRKYDSELLEP
jgi:hypothetical protein